LSAFERSRTRQRRKLSCARQSRCPCLRRLASSTTAVIKLAVARSPCSRQSFRKVGKTEIWHPSEQDRSFTERPSARDGSGCTPYTKQTLALERGLGVRHLREPSVSGDSRMASTSLICVIASRRRICRNRIALSDATLPTIPNQTRNPSPTRRYRPYLT
jgi:hypothetical protein